MIRLIAGLLVLVTVSGCVTTTSSENSTLPPPGIAFQYVLESDRDMASYSECKAVLTKKEDSSLKVEISLKKGLDRVIAAVPAGTYSFSSATCDRGFHIKIQPHTPMIVPSDGVLFLGSINIDRFRPTTENYSGSLRIDSRSIESNQSVLSELNARSYKTYWYVKPLAP